MAKITYNSNQIRQDNVGLEPTEGRKTSGRSPEDKLPADELNFYRNQYETIINLLKNSVNDIGSIPSAGGTAAALTIAASGSFALVTGNWGQFIVTAAGTIDTLNVDSTGVLNARDKADAQIDVEVGDVVTYIYDGVDFLLAPKGGGNIAWIQIFKGANAILKDEKAKDVVIKIGEYVYNEFYPVAIVPPNGDLTVKSLLHMDGADTSTVITDEVGNVWTANGDAQLDTAVSKFGVSSLLLSGAGYIDTPDSDFFNVGTQDFTLELWLKRSVVSGSIEYFLGQVSPTATSTTAMIQAKITALNILNFIMFSGATNYSVSSTTTFNNLLQAHVALVRESNDLNLYINGILESTVDVTGVSFNDSIYKMTIGRYGEFPNTPFNGHVDEFRFVKGEAKYTSNFTPPTQAYDFAPSQIIPPTTQATDKLKSLLHMDGIDASTTFADETGVVWTANGNAQIDTAESKFGGASALFDGASWIDRESDDDLDFSNKHFTIDFWVKRNLDGTLEFMLGQGDSGNTSDLTPFRFAFNADNTIFIRFRTTQSTDIDITSVGEISNDSIFHHIAVTRDADTLRLFIDGSVDGTSSVTGVSIITSPNKLAIGRLGERAILQFDGHIDEFRINIGTAKWTTNFTPPTVPYVYEDEQDINLQALIDGTLEMASPETDQVYQGFKSKIDLWDANMEGALPDNVESTEDGEFTLTTTTLDVNVSDVDLTKSFIEISLDTIAANPSQHVVSVQLVDIGGGDIKARFTADSGVNADIYWKIITYKNATVQRGSVSSSNSNITLSELKDYHKARSVSYMSATSGNGDDVIQKNKLTSNTNLNVSTGVNGAGSPHTEWQVLEEYA